MKNIIFIIALLSITACSTVQEAQYSALEKVGIHKRDILVDRIEKTAKTQAQTKEQFKSAYDELASLVAIQDEGLEKKYKRMAKAVEASEDKAEELNDRITGVDHVAKSLFSEWREELKQYQNPNLRRTSENNLKTTQQRYNVLYQKMQASQQRIDPVLKILQDNTLFLKHNLNARAISSLSSEVLTIENKVSLLIKQMEASINESEQFIRAMKQP